MLNTVVGTEQVGDDIVNHKQLDPRPLLAAVCFFTLTIATMIVVITQ
jgi:hypothetical protein